MKVEIKIGKFQQITVQLYNGNLIDFKLYGIIQIVDSLCILNDDVIKINSLTFTIFTILILSFRGIGY